jgi:NAD(P)-dependent dehydrogenase (short-subunit alcohol dehydrogenase family)
MTSVAVVTGSAGRIGRGYALGLSAEGHCVVVADLNLKGAEETVMERANNHA